MKLNKINIFLAIIFVLSAYCIILNFYIFHQKSNQKKQIDNLQNVFIEQHRVIKIEKILKDTFKISDERAKICATLIDVYSDQWNIEWEKLAALMRVESNFNYYAKSILTKGSKNEPMQRAYSLMQIKPTTAKGCAEELGMEWNGLETVMNPVDNVKMGAYYYAKMNLIFKDFRKTINAYNSGPQSVYNHSESINNWNRVQFYYNKLKGIKDEELEATVKKLDDDYIHQQLVCDSLETDSLIKNETKIKQHRRK